MSINFIVCFNAQSLNIFIYNSGMRNMNVDCGHHQSISELDIYQDLLYEVYVLPDLAYMESMWIICHPLYKAIHSLSKLLLICMLLTTIVLE